jgi:membrane protease YdiL (CAAX protease family)
MKIITPWFHVRPGIRPFALFAVIYFGTALLQPLFLLLLGENFMSASLFLLLSMVIMAQSLTLIIIALFAKSDFGCNALLKSRPKALLKGILVCAPMPLVELALRRFGGAFPGWAMICSLIKFQVPAVAFLVLAFFLCEAFLAPVLEEVAMRGFLQTSFMHNYGEMASIILTACCFSVTHWEMRNPGQAVYSFLLGILFSYWRLKEKTLWTAIGGHIAFNASAIVASLLLCELPKEVLATLQLLAPR